MFKVENEKLKLPYRAGIGAMIINKNKQVFVGQRIDNRSEAWQMPQGGIDLNETERQALMRELYEEVGTNNFTIIAISKRKYRYDIPESLISKFWQGKYRGQEQKWFLLKFLGEDSEINIHLKNAEFRAWKWVSIEELQEITVPFKRQLYTAILEEFKSFLK
jgi:putative (di)nucleoside polyphosphate hydrolase